jgi:hypothetical protein
VAPETLKPDPAVVAAFTVTAAVPVEVRVRDCVDGVLTLTLPKARLEVLTPNVGTDAVNCRVKVAAVPPAFAVRVADCTVLTEDTVAVKPAFVEPAGTVAEAGSVTAELLLARLTGNPPLAAAAFSMIVQLSVPAPVNEPVAQFRELSTGTPVPLRPTRAVDPDDELLVMVSEPETAPAVEGSNCTDSLVL